MHILKPRPVRGSVRAFTVVPVFAIAAGVVWEDLEKNISLILHIVSMYLLM